jgi:hypothetical protein
MTALARSHSVSTGKDRATMKLKTSGYATHPQPASHAVDVTWTAVAG